MALRPPVSRYSPLYRDSHKEEMGSSPAPLQRFSFFFLFFSIHFFFFFIHATGKQTTQKILYYIYIFFFSISSIPNKFIKIYFIHFFSSFTHCKTQKKFQHIYVLITKHTITQHITLQVMHTIHTYIHNNSSNNHLITQHTCYTSNHS